jgi:hypothetical protein
LRAAKRQVYAERESKKKPKEEPNRVPLRAVPDVKRKGDKPAVEPLTPRECQYRHLPGHYLISCPACEGFPED